MMVTVTEREEGGEMGVSFIVVTRSRLLLVCMCVCVCVCVCRHSPHVCVFVKGDPSACFFRYVNVCVIIQFDEQRENQIQTTYNIPVKKNGGNPFNAKVCGKIK